MNNISSISKLAFFSAEKLTYPNNYIVDTSARPRPHFCMGLILSGSAEFFDCAENATHSVSAGDIIFVPISSRYKATWLGNPDVTYISMHFSFDFPGIFSRKGNFIIQKVTCDNPDKLKSLFHSVLTNYRSKDDALALSALSDFMYILSKIFPLLIKKQNHQEDIRINNAIEFIEENYTKSITIEKLASNSNMSVSRFFPAFKKTVGITPVEYLNNHRINRAIILLINNKELTIEEVSEKCGFESSAYFRKVFKKITGKTPREYRKSVIEI